MSQQTSLLGWAALYSLVAIAAQLCVPFHDLPLWLADIVSVVGVLGCLFMCWAAMPMRGVRRCAIR